LLRSWWDELRRARALHKLRQPIDRARLRKLASSYVLLETRIDPNRLELDSPVRATRWATCTTSSARSKADLRAIPRRPSWFSRRRR
jgi:hypothetical protein